MCLIPITVTFVYKIGVVDSRSAARKLCCRLQRWLTLLFIAQQCNESYDAFRAWTPWVAENNNAFYTRGIHHLLRAAYIHWQRSDRCSVSPVCNSCLEYTYRASHIQTLIAVFTLAYLSVAGKIRRYFNKGARHALSSILLIAFVIASQCLQETLCSSPLLAHCRKFLFYETMTCLTVSDCFKSTHRWLPRNIGIIL